MEKVKKTGAELEGEGEDLAGEICFPTRLILKLLISWSTRLAKELITCY